MEKPLTPIVVVMGIMASGKTTVGRALAQTLDWPFQEGDELHPPANRHKLAAGTPLTDADRQPWLAAIGLWMDKQQEANLPGVVSCSALRRQYRDLLRQGRPEVHFVVLDGDPEVIRARLAQRHGHFASPDLLDSQIATLETPGADEHALALPIDIPVKAQCDRIIAWLDGAAPTRDVNPRR